MLQAFASEACKADSVQAEHPVAFSGSAVGIEHGVVFGNRLNHATVGRQALLIIVGDFNAESVVNGVLDESTNVFCA